MRPVREATAALVGVGAGGDQAAATAGHVGAHAHPGLWRTPTPYLFLGFAMMMALIAVALLILLCTRRKPSAGLSRRGSDAESASARGTMAPLDREPKVVVIMAGDHMPSFIASARPFAAFSAVNEDAGELPKAEAA